MAPATRLNTHQVGCFYERFDVLTAHQLSNRLVLQYTPTHASWLNMAELEFAALSKQYLDRQIGDLATLEKKCWLGPKRAIKPGLKSNGPPSRWLFDTGQARQKLKRHYVKLNSENNTIIGPNN
ncbi:hypothetical protein GO730_11350 [Spirosoma sp. HMF3257]|uniref:Uncharacterized protein n=1 Tax=Spirosoma telluris TaxID=2183553 RepID=A0A327NKW4_9BACT|nr:hypothetical protein [Spirosoma telluris]RAI74696.1 hypothetical protein HMF3257_11270 [Spirosoma telluris]